MHSLLAVKCLAILALSDSYATGLSTVRWNARDLHTVPTSNGPITGHPASNSSDVLEFLGIPYGKPPVGDLRFAPPQRFAGNGSYEASNFGFDCPLSPSRQVDYPDMTPQAQRIIGYFASAAGTPQSEDCLTLNVWTKPTGNALTAAKPVIVFFYGGRLAIGNTNSPFYNGKYFADAQDVVIVTVNYRINVFGFPGAPGQPQNLGLMDQRTAVEWVRDNIAGFGGDPAKITIAGQSSGGVAVDYWSYAYIKDPIINGLIAPGAYHGVDLHMIFGASGDVSGIQPSDAQRKTTALMQSAWATFANDPVDGLSSVLGWPKFDPNEESLVLLAVDNDPEPQFVKPSTYDAPCSTITLGALGTATPSS
ncbi:hypothetical protein SGCOL_003003 [Colletotrichum sp. CLE4]